MVRCYGGKTNDHNQLVAEVRGVKIVNIDSYHFMKLECEGKEGIQTVRYNGECPIF